MLERKMKKNEKRRLMKTRRIWIVLLTITTLLVIGAWSAYGHSNRPAKPVLYRVVSRSTLTNDASLQKSLSDLGNAGYELILVDKDDYIFKHVP
jgi:hypothetical protein